MQTYSFNDLFEEIRWIVGNINPNEYTIVTPNLYVHTLLKSAYKSDVILHCEEIPISTTPLLLCACNEHYWHKLCIDQASVITYHRFDMNGYTLIPCSGITSSQLLQRQYPFSITENAFSIPPDTQHHFNKISAHAIALFMQDPEAFYIKYCLKVHPQIAFEKHEILRKFLHGFQVEIPLIWKKQFEVIKQEWDKTLTCPIKTDVRGSFVLDGITIEANADRIDFIAPDCIGIIDYKMSTVPTKKQLHDFIYPQLYILAYTFKEKYNVEYLRYYLLKGYGEKPFEVIEIPVKPIDEIEEFLRQVITNIKNIGMNHKEIILPRKEYNHFKRQSALLST